MARVLDGLPKLAEWSGFQGYRSSVPDEEGGNYLARGSENVIMTGSGKLQAFKGMAIVPGKLGGIVMMNVAERQDAYASLGAATGVEIPDLTAYGNVFNVYACLFYIGKGLLRLQGESLGVYADPYLRLLVKEGGSYVGGDNGPFTAGLSQPLAPSIRSIPIGQAGVGFTGKCNGVVSVVIWRIRSSTGAISIHSEVSNIISTTNESVAVQIYDEVENGQDYWGIGVTRNGEGSVGSHFEHIEVPEFSSPGVVGVENSNVGGTARTIEIEWRDGDLIGKQLAPFHDFPPPLGFFASAIEDIVVVDGTYSGTSGSAISPSEPGKPESFSPDSAIFTNDLPTGLIRGNGLIYRFGRNSCYLIKYMAGEEKPVSVEIAWEGIGIEHQHNACIGEGGRLYFWASDRGLMRLGQFGNPEGEFATDIADDIAECPTAIKRVLGWDPKLQVIAFCYEKKIWCWFTALEKWGSPLDLTGMITGDIRSCVPENGVLLITDWNDNLYEFNAGTGSVMRVRTGWAVSKGGMDTVALILAAVRADNTEPVTIETFADGNDDAVVSSIQSSPTRKGYQRLPSVYPNVTECESHAVQVTIKAVTTDGDVGIESIATYGEEHSMLR